MKPRPYQAKCIDRLYDYLAEGDRNGIAVLPTAAGKSVIIAEFVRRSLADYPFARILILAHQKELLQQNAAKLLAVWPECPLGVYSAGLGARQINAQILVAGIQSVFDKAYHLQTPSAPDLVIIDECHLLSPKSNTMYRRLLGDLKQINPHVRVLGASATPWRLDSGPLIGGENPIFHDIVFEIGILELVEQGYLCPLVSKATVTRLDTSGVAIRGGDFVVGELQRAVDVEETTAAAVDEIVELGKDRVAWLVFCTGVDHALHVRDAIRAKDITCETVTGETPAAERANILRRFGRGEIRALTNANVLCLDTETEILTSDGWVGPDGMTDQHNVASWDMDGSILFAPPKLIVRRPLAAHERMVSVAGNRSNIRVTSNHRMVVKSRHGAWDKRAAEDIAGQSVYLPVSGHADPDVFVSADANIPKATLRRRVAGLSYKYRTKGMCTADAKAAAEKHVAWRAGLRHKTPHELTLDECSFIGFWLGDGTLSPRCEFSQSKAYPAIVEWFDGILSRTGLGHSRSEAEPSEQLPSGYVRWSIARGTGGGCQRRETGYFPLEPYLSKEGSRLYWGLNGEQFDALLHGFWMADGNHGQGDGNSATGTYVAGTQKQLYDMLQCIGACRGLSCTISPLADRNRKHSPQWRFSWRKADSIQLVRDLMEIEPQRKDEDVWCVTSATGNIVTRRRGKVTVVGNTTGVDIPSIDLIAFLRPTKSSALYMQMAGRAMRLSPETGKVNGLCLDFARVIQTHGPVDQVRPKDKKKGEASAPVKGCPECEEMIYASARVCPCCDYEFPLPEEKPAFEKTASLLNIMSTEAPPATVEWLAVNSVSYRLHSKPGKPNSVRATYQCGLLQHNEWHCLSHDGFPRQKAIKWWREATGQKHFPASSEEALEQQSLIRQPSHIAVRPSGKYTEIVARRYESEAQAA